MSPPAGEPDEASGPRLLTDRDLFLLAVAAAVVTANAYYIHPIIALVADDLGVSHSRIGLVPALNQIALAIGIFVLLPLGDRFSNRLLATIFSAGQFIGLLMMALAPGFWLFTAGSTFLGFATITPYLLPAYASKRVAPQRLGRATATLTTGVIAGILVARVGAGWIGEHADWRVVYGIAAALMLAVTLALPRLMQGATGRARRRSGSTTRRLSCRFSRSCGAIRKCWSPAPFRGSASGYSCRSGSRSGCTSPVRKWAMALMWLAT